MSIQELKQRDQQRREEYEAAIREREQNRSNNGDIISRAGEALIASRIVDAIRELNQKHTSSEIDTILYTNKGSRKVLSSYNWNRDPHGHYSLGHWGGGEVRIYRDLTPVNLLLQQISLRVTWGADGIYKPSWNDANPAPREDGKILLWTQARYEVIYDNNDQLVFTSTAGTKILTPNEWKHDDDLLDTQLIIADQHPFIEPLQYRVHYHEGHGGNGVGMNFSSTSATFYLEQIPPDVQEITTSEGY
jgi:hypothetical protein